MLPRVDVRLVVAVNLELILEKVPRAAHNVAREHIRNLLARAIVILVLLATIVAQAPSTALCVKLERTPPLALTCVDHAVEEPTLLRALARVVLVLLASLV
jgi:redox-regulated HSP33 family molecular chaperone